MAVLVLQVKREPDVGLLVQKGELLVYDVVLEGGLLLGLENHLLDEVFEGLLALDMHDLLLF